MVYHVKYSDKYVQAWVPVEQKGFAFIYGITRKHLHDRNPGLDDTQLELATEHLLPLVCYLLYRR